ncbi:CIC11C00000001684 [Sungouiella intermedia]|uniref:assimilatory sulfite reductase (NADPH) n=1 Tax=Sungouiella intermedia TaxID=45354 RepID=A0A1L0BZX2_9ASCO|nr:CIC11C00000001684 [[Candida] intermedia]
MAVNQTEAIAGVISLVGGSVFTTQPSKAIKSAFAGYVASAHALIDTNEPFQYVGSYIEENQPENTVTVTTDGQTLFNNLPLLSLKPFKTTAVVVHVEVSSFDYEIVTALTDSSYPVLVSQTPLDAAIYAQAAYATAAAQKLTVFHIYAPSSLKENVQVAEPKNAVESLADALAEFKIAPFSTLNKVKSKDAILFLGQVSRDLVDAATVAGALFISVNVYQPFDLKALLSQLPATVETLTLVEQSSKVTSFSPLLLEFFKSYSSHQSLKNFSKIVAAKFGYVVPEKYEATVSNLLANTRSDSPVQNLSFGKLTELSTKSFQQKQSKKSDDIKKVYDLEQAYLKVLKQINGSTKILNDFSAETVDSSNPEYGYGHFLYFKEQQNALASLVSSAIQKGAFSSLNNSKLIELLSQWLVQLRRGQPYANLDELVKLLSSDDSPDASEILSLKQYLEIGPSWLIGSDAWSYDLGSSGVHNVIASGQNVNMLIIDSEPYSDKKLNVLRKKDVGLYAMNYGNCYVASVAIYSSYTQVLQAFIEAEKFDGPSVVLAYLPYESEHSDILSILKETKSAVDTGYWPLYRYDPTIKEDADKFKLDSSSLRNQLKDFLDRENKLTLLAAKNPELLRNLTATANSGIKKQQAQIEDESFKQLLQGLSGPPLTIGFASDGGNAEALARKINRQALGRGLKSVVLSMDDITVEDLPTETNVILVSSTAGQGEIPNNGKAFWDELKNAQDLDLSSVKFSCFGLGDSKYWPRKEDKHYYNKPAQDLYSKFKLYGGVELADLGLGDDQDPDGFSTGFDEWIPKIWKALGVDNVEGVEEPKPLTNEDMKIQSDFLRGTIAEGLKDDSTGAICAVDQQLTKFHGIYMQDDRDIREERKLQGMEPAYSFMVRLRLPGGAATPSQYLRLDELCDVRGNGTLKITTRATFQLHGIVKHDLKPAIRGMNATLLDTLAACGDVNRNVMLSALPGNATVHKQIAHDGSFISEYLLPQTTAYHEIWLEGPDAGDKEGDQEVWENRKDGPKKKKTMVAGNALVDYEPMYGPTYLPRKFKIVITVPPYNDVDVYAHDVGLIAIVEDNVVVGYNVLAGGGMGSTHNNTKTYPRTGSMMGFVSREKVHIACENIMLVQRDNGDRTNRKHARLKYTIDDMGVDVFRKTVEEYWGEKFEEPRAFEIKSNIDYFGWVKDEFGLNHFTAFIENGRIEDTPELPQKTGLKKIAEYLIEKQASGEFRLTGNQHLLLSKVSDEDLPAIKELLAQYKLDNTDFSGLRLSSSSCVALPTCGLAMAEAERYLPELVTKLENALESMGLRHDSVVMRMTGCPNGCARPWVAEVALVGKAMGAYNLMLGGGHHGQRLNKIYRYSIKEDEIMDILLPLFKRWSLERHEGEPFGDFCIRIGVINETTEGKYFHEGIPEEA